MSRVWEGFRSSRMALLAVSALLLGASPYGTLAVVAAASNWQASGPGGHMISLGGPIATLSRTISGAGEPRHGVRTGEPRHGVRTESKALGCHHENADSCTRKGTQPAVGKVFSLSRRKGRRDSTSATTATTNRIRVGLDAWRFEQDTQATPLREEAPWLKATGTISGPRATSMGSAMAWQRQELGTRLTRWLRDRGTTSSADHSEQQQPRYGRRQQQRQQHGPVSDTDTTAMVKTPTAQRSTSPASASTATSAAASATAPSRVPSYLRWPKEQDNAAEPGHQDDEGGERMRTRSRTTARADSGGGHSAAEGESLGADKMPRGGAVAVVNLSFKEAMFAGAVSRSLAQTIMQPANVVKTLLQGRGTSAQLSNLSFKLLTRGAGAQFVMSLPHGAFNYATLEVILGCSAKIFPPEWRERAGPVLDFFSSSAATLVCSVVSTPQMVLTDRIMAGMYPNLVSGIREISRTEGLRGFYTGWSANVAQKIPSYGLTWVFFQQFKRLHRKATDRPPTNTENFVLGAAAAGATVCIMIPMDTVKTRLVTQTAQAGIAPYQGVLRTLSRVVNEEGFGALYRSLTPRLVSVVPMIGIQFGIYEFVRKELMSRKESEQKPRSWLPPAVRRKLGVGDGRVFPQPEYVKDFLRNVYLLEEELV